MRRTVSALAVVFVLAGCSDSSKPDPLRSSSKQTASDTTVAKRAVLQLRDLPHGYTESHVPEGASDRAAEEKLLSCLGVPDARVRAGRVQVRGRIFEQTLSSASIREVASAVVVEPKAADLARPFGVLTHSRAAPCLETYMRHKITSDVRLAKLHPRGLTVRSVPAPAIGDQQAGFEARVTFSVSGQSIDTTYEFYFARRGRAVAQLVVVGLGTLFPPTQTASLLQTVVGRLRGFA
jgi:hypothetical protein